MISIYDLQKILKDSEIKVSVFRKDNTQDKLKYTFLLLVNDYVVGAFEKFMKEPIMFFYLDEKIEGYNFIESYEIQSLDEEMKEVINLTKKDYPEYFL